MLGPTLFQQIYILFQINCQNTIQDNQFHEDKRQHVEERIKATDYRNRSPDAADTEMTTRLMGKTEKHWQRLRTNKGAYNQHFQSVLYQMSFSVQGRKINKM